MTWNASKTFNRCLIGVIAIGVLPHCKFTKKQLGNHSGFIIGLNNMVPSTATSIEENEVSLSQIRAIGSIASVESGRGTHFCTGFAIKPKKEGQNPLIVANYHCFSQHSATNADFAPWACTQTKIYFGAKSDDANSLFAVGCKTGSLRGNAAADIAVFEAATALPEDIDLFELEDMPYSESRAALLIHHPFTVDNMVSLPSESQKVPGSVINKVDCNTSLPVRSQATRPETGFKFDIAHTCDIVEGSSGAPLIDLKSGKVIAVNWGGIQWGEGDDSVYENRAVDAAWVKAYLNDEIPKYEAIRNKGATSSRSDNSSAISSNSPAPISTTDDDSAPPANSQATAKSGRSKTEKSSGWSCSGK